MAAFFIPYSIAWFAASNEPARAVLGTIIPNLDDKLRHHFGDEEHDPQYVLSYTDQQQGEEPHYQLDGEPTYRERMQQTEVAALNQTDVKVRVRVDGTSDSFVETVLPGSTPARSDAILHAMGMDTHSQNAVVAIDFGNVVDDTDSLSEQDELTWERIDSITKESPLLHETYAYSLWHYLAPPPDQQGRARMSSFDIEVSRLQHEIQQLQHDLNDVSCTRDRDDMVRDLKEAKSTLRGLQWKRRLGLAKS